MARVRIWTKDYGAEVEYGIVPGEDVTLGDLRQRVHEDFERARERHKLDRESLHLTVRETGQNLSKVVSQAIQETLEAAATVRNRP